MITFSKNQIKDESEAVRNTHWIDNHNGTISCSHCQTWFHKDDRYYYMRYCPFCKKQMLFPEISDEENSEIKDYIKDLSKRVETLEKQIKEDKEEQLKKLKADREEQIKRLKGELDYARFRYSCYLACNIAESEE